MSVHDCIQAYKRVSRKAFTRKLTSVLPLSPSGAYSAKALKAVIKQVLREFCNQPECKKRRDAGGDLSAESCQHSDVAFHDPNCTKT